jgi:hypothetical protein
VTAQARNGAMQVRQVEREMSGLLQIFFAGVIATQTHQDRAALHADETINLEVDVQCVRRMHPLPVVEKIIFSG